MKTLLKWCKGLVLGATVGVLLAVLVPQPAMAWDRQPNDQEFDGAVLVNRDFYLGAFTAAGKLRSSAAELSAVAPSNGFARIGFPLVALAVPTNGATLTATNAVWSLTASGGGVTNALTISAPSSPTNACQLLLLRVASGQTNWVKVTDGATAILSGDWIGTANDTLLLMSFGNGTNWVEVSRSDN